MKTFYGDLLQRKDQLLPILLIPVLSHQSAMVLPFEPVFPPNPALPLKSHLPLKTGSPADAGSSAEAGSYQV